MKLYEAARLVRGQGLHVCLRGEEVYLTARGNQDYHAHSIDVHFDQDRGLALEPDMGSISGWKEELRG